VTLKSFSLGVIAKTFTMVYWHITNLDLSDGSVMLLGLCCQIAICNASQINYALIRELMLQPSTFLEHRSITIARYSQPSYVQIYVTSAA